MILKNKPLICQCLNLMTLESDKHIVFFCDLLGGTPYKQAAVISTKSDKDISVVCGCNVGALLENGLTGIDKFTDSVELANSLIKSTKQGIKLFGMSNHTMLLNHYLMEFNT